MFIIYFTQITRYPNNLTRFKLTQYIEKQRLLHKRVRKNFPKRNFQIYNIRTRRPPWKIKKNGRFLYLPLVLVIPTGFEPVLQP